MFRRLLCAGSLLFLTAFVCEYVLYYWTVHRCSWPTLPQVEYLLPSKFSRVLVLADPHLVGPVRGHPLDRIRRDWQMRQAFQTALAILQPNLVFILGDIFDEGSWIGDADFLSHLERYHYIFQHDRSKTIVKNVVGNHDIGFHYAIYPYVDNRFRQKMTPSRNSSSVRLWSHAGVHYVMANSMAFEGDECYLCSEAEHNVRAIAYRLQCMPINRSATAIARCPLEESYSQPKSFVDLDSDTSRPYNYTRPILLQHFPLYRDTENPCSSQPADAMPHTGRLKRYRPRWDCLSLEASQKLLEQLRPRLVLSGHSHYACQLEHRLPGEPDTVVPEITVASFSWRNLPNPSFLLLTVSPTEHAVSKCFLPTELTIVVFYILGLVLTVCTFFCDKYMVRAIRRTVCRRRVPCV
ncbi:hypothetical protein CRM22_004531 [Opisthorchis felineus]|uniref:Calcineurin-like phosphoesterase domain-containing protein n=1 Tax=Opisthorchis felineus TaxID=147828 RepID=A0A4S2LVQ3_OPIFE|nr:hypothetical protein CRM22_004531 [Opisthorchis felineus]